MIENPIVIRNYVIGYDTISNQLYVRHESSKPITAFQFSDKELYDINLWYVKVKNDELTHKRENG